MSVPPSTVIAGLLPARLTPASRVVTGPRLRGTAPCARTPRTARARRRVSAVRVPHSSRTPAGPDRGRASAAATRRARPRPARRRSASLLARPARPSRPPARGPLLAGGIGRQAGDRPRQRHPRHRLAAGGDEGRDMLGQGRVVDLIEAGPPPGRALPFPLSPPPLPPV